MTAPTLNISSTLSLPLDYVTKTAAVLAQRRKGKTYTASVIAEELTAAEQPWVALDPTGAWWGLRASADGESAGLPVVILGGQHGDAPLERTAGRYVAELVVESPGWYVLDLSLFDSRAAEREFATDFGEALIRRKRQPGRDFPMHLFVDEADMFAPQEKESGDQRMLGAYQAIVRRGGLHGLGSTLISQRPALLNKSVLTQLDLLVLLRLVAGQDQDAVDKNYLNRAGDPVQRSELMASLASLGLGEAWVWEPGAEPPLFQRLQIRERRTFNSSATPKPGEVRVEPRRLADVDLDAVKAAMEAAIERAKADDPKELRRRIAGLERDLAEARADRDAWPVVERVEVPVLDATTLAELGEVVGRWADAIGPLKEMYDQGLDMLGSIGPLLKEARDRQDLPRARPAGRGAGPVAPRPAERAPQRPDPAPGRDAGRAAVPRAAVPAGPGSLLRVLTARYPAWLTRRQIVTLAKRGPKSSSLDGHFGYLVDNGLAERDWTDGYRATQAGLDAMGSEPAVDPIEAWHGAFSGATQKVFDALVRVYPERYTKDGIADLAGLSRTSSSVGQALTELRRNGLVEDHHDGTQAADILFEGRA